MNHVNPHHHHRAPLATATTRQLVVPVALQSVFRNIDPTREGQWFYCRNVTFTLVEAQFVHDYFRRNPHAVIRVDLDCCSFLHDYGHHHHDDGHRRVSVIMDLLKDAFATMTAADGLQVLPFVRLILREKNDLLTAWFPLATDFVTFLDLSHCHLDDADFKQLVDILLIGGHAAKKILRYLNVSHNRISSNGLAVDATRLVEQSQLECLDMAGNNGMLDDGEQVQLICNKLKKNKILQKLDLRQCRASEATANATTIMLVDMLTVNTTLTAFLFDQNEPASENDNINYYRRLEPWLKRNRRLEKVLARVQELLHANNNNNNNAIHIPDALWGPILHAAMEDFDRDKSALFLLLCKAIIGQEACPLHEKIAHFLREALPSPSSSSV